MRGPTAEVVAPDAGRPRALVAPAVEVDPVRTSPAQGVVEDHQQLARRDSPEFPSRRACAARQAAGAARVGRVGDVNDLNRSLASAADVGAVLRERECRVETSGTEVVVTDLLERGRRVCRLSPNWQQPERARKEERTYGPASCCYRLASRIIALGDGDTASLVWRAPTVTRRQRYAAAVNATPVNAAWSNSLLTPKPERTRYAPATP